MLTSAATSAAKLGFLSNISPEVWAAIITASIAIITVVYSQRKTRQIAYFQTLFVKKLELYSGYWEAIASFETTPSPENRANLLAKTHEVALYSPENIYVQTLIAARKISEGENLDGIEIEHIVDLMRQDLKACQKMKFDSHPASDPVVNHRSDTENSDD